MLDEEDHDHLENYLGLNPMARISQPELVAQLFQTPGVVGRTIGEVVYVCQCEETPATIRQ